jgi:hypothetical protein
MVNHKKIATVRHPGKQNPDLINHRRFQYQECNNILFQDNKQVPSLGAT